MKTRRLAELGAVAVLVVLIAGATGCSSSSAPGSGAPAVTLDLSSVNISLSGTADITATSTDASDTSFIWTVDIPGVVSITSVDTVDAVAQTLTSVATVTGIYAATVTITATADPSGLFAEIDVTVTNGGGGVSAALLADAVALDLDVDSVLTFTEANSGATTVTQAEFDTIDASNAGATTDGLLSLSELISDVGGVVVTGDIQNGGLLYDKFWAVTGVAASEPTTDHTIWATQTEGNARTGSDTWRCKECHGWDYKGVAGAYAPGSSHATGFKGIFTLVTATTDFEVFDLIKTDHEYGVAGLTDPEILDLTDFTKNQPSGLVDTDNIIVAGAFNGDTATGQVLYDTTRTCALCHGATGLNMPPAGSTNDYFADYPGLLAVDNPWEFQHKINYGQPGPGAMAFAAALTETETSDLGAYAQTLPDMLALPGGTLDVVNGGRLYDKWWADAGDTPPATDHPIWADQDTNLREGADTWRCKECHGWDYKGVDGAYASGSHMTGFAGIFGTTKTLQEVYNTIWTDHQFGNKMTDADIQDAAEFVVNGQLDVDTIIDGAGAFIGDTVVGDALYTSTGCALCHGADGLSIPPGGDPAFDAFPGFLSNDNPQEYQHKINYGQPGSAMDFGSTLTVTETGDLGAFSQTLPQN